MLHTRRTVVQPAGKGTEGGGVAALLYSPALRQIEHDDDPS